MLWLGRHNISKPPDCSFVRPQSWTRIFTYGVVLSLHKPIMLSLHKPMPCGSIIVCKLPRCRKTWFWQQVRCDAGRAKLRCTCNPIKMMKTDKRQSWAFCVLTTQTSMLKTINWALVHAHPSKRKWCKHIATRQCLSYNSPVCTLNGFATMWHVRIVLDGFECVFWMSCGFGCMCATPYWHISKAYDP